MKYIFIFLFALLVTGCNRFKYVDITGNMPGIDNGIIVIKDVTGNSVCNANVFGGKFDKIHQFLPVAGYYDLFITPDITKDYKKHVYDIYLEPGTYTISIDTSQLDGYPVITSSSVMQNELSDYYKIANSKMDEAKAQIQKLKAQLLSKSGPVIYSDPYNKLLLEIDMDTKSLDNIQAEALADFVNIHPQNYVEAHILAGIDYKQNPEAFYQIYQKFTLAEKNSVDGKGEVEDLSQLAKLNTGDLAPQLAGKTPDGKPFDPNTIHKKIILVEFWRASNDVSRANHLQLLTDMNSPLKNNDFTVVSVSLDTVASVWKSAIKQDNLTWAQLNDLKGEASPNMDNWSVTAVPTYDLVDGSWHIIKRNVEYNQIGIEVQDYLMKSH